MMNRTEIVEKSINGDEACLHKKQDITASGKVNVQIPVKRDFGGSRKNVMEARAVEVNGKTYKKMMKQWGDRPYSMEEMMFYDDLFGDEKW